jgi:PAS domain S-box-containing protein
MISADPDGFITSWNEGAHRIFGYTADEFLGQSILGLIPVELHLEEYTILGKLKAGERIDHYETVRVGKGGERFKVSVTGTPVNDDAGRVIGALTIAHLITPGARVDDSRFRLAAIVDSADDAIISKNLNGVITSWNDGARRMFGYVADEIVGQSLLRLIPKELQYEEAEILRKLRAGERIEHYETVRVNKSGERVEVSVTISPVRDASGEVIGASKIARNISDRKRMEKMLIQSEKLAATGRMAAAIAHEINNPLESLMNLIFLARQNSPVAGKAYGYLLTAEKELERVSHIARQTLGYYRDTGSPSEVYIHNLIERVLSIYKSKLDASGISVETAFNDLRKITVSAGELVQVFSNVIANAIDAMQKGGRLSISIRKTTAMGGDGIQTIIRDRGTGIRPEHLEKIFEPFFTTKGNLGTGIGLWVTKQLVERRGGQITVTSNTEPGTSGTTVSIFIPFVNYMMARVNGQDEIISTSQDGARS